MSLTRLHATTPFPSACRCFANNHHQRPTFAGILRELENPAHAFSEIEPEAFFDMQNEWMRCLRDKYGGGGGGDAGGESDRSVVPPTGTQAFSRRVRIINLLSLSDSFC